MRTSIAVVTLLSGCITELPEVSDPCAEWSDPGLFRITLEPDDSRTRKPHVYVPATAGPRRMVVLLHGAGQNGSNMSERTNFLRGAEEFGYVLVYPNGLGWPLRTWNAGTEFDDGHDDVAFLDGLVEQLQDRVCVDKVLATGFSNGAMMVHRWGCEGTQVDAVAPVAGPLMLDACEGDPVPLRHYHGLDDAVVPYQGGVPEQGLEVDYPSVSDTFGQWIERNQCEDLDPAETVVGDTTCLDWSCEASTVLCTVSDWGHRWPGGIHHQQTDANASRAIWDWFNEVVP
ncbi:MAG: hypothetical protein KTR31_19350 [Myxococcales bacterium]|nr:hypothetical protein [Myxococcales bacterium]